MFKKPITNSVDPDQTAPIGSNLRPLDLQSDSQLLPDMLPTVLRGPVGQEYHPGNFRAFFLSAAFFFL